MASLDNEPAPTSCQRKTSNRVMPMPAATFASRVMNSSVYFSKSKQAVTNTHQASAVLAASASASCTFNAHVRPHRFQTTNKVYTNTGNVKRMVDGVVS